MRRFNAVILKEAYDGDTFKLMVDIGFNVFIEKGLRLGGMWDAAEVRQDSKDLNNHEKQVGLYTRDLVRIHFPIGSKVVILSENQKTGKYGRIIGDILFEGVSLMSLLMMNGLVVREQLTNEQKQVEWETMYKRLGL